METTVANLIGLLTCLVTLWTVILAQQQPVLQILPDRNPIIEALHRSMLITCNVNHLENPNIDPHLKWFTSSGDEIRETAGLRYIERAGFHSLKLYFTSIRPQDAGTYTCQAELEGSIQEMRADLELFKDITFDEVPSPQKFAIYSTAHIRCVVSGQPMPTVSYRVNGKTIVTGGRYIQGQSGLTIHNVTKNDENIYLCRAEISYEGRYEEKEIRVDVQIPPTILKPMGTQTGIETQEGSLTCYATGDPMPKFDFFRGTTELLSSRDDISEREVIVDRDAGVILFKPLSKHDAGEYRCRAFNDVGFIEDTGELEVWVQPRIVTLINQTAEEGQSQSLECVVEGNPPPQIQFQKVQHGIAYPPYDAQDNDGGRVTIDNSVTNKLKMTIYPLSPDDTANYTCIASNLAGDTKRNGTLIVLHSPRFDANHPSEFYFWAGKTRNVTCFSISEPEPNFRWFKDGKELQNNETYRIYVMHKNSNLQISARIEDQGWVFGTYTCQANNNYGTGEKPMNVKRATVPGPPNNVTILQSGPTMVKFKVNLPTYDGRIKVTEYRLEFDQSIRRVDLDEPVTIENLSPQKTYMFNIRAANEVGFGEAFVLTFKTDAIRVPSPLQLQPPPPNAEYPYNFELKWQKPETGGLPIIEYEFKIRRVEVDEQGRVDEPVGDWIRSLRTSNPRAPLRSFKFENLSPNTYYEVIALATNDVGDSLANSEYVFRTKDDPRYRPISRSSHTCWTPSLFTLSVLLQQCICRMI